MTNVPVVNKGHAQRHKEESQEHIKTAYVCDPTVELNDIVYLDSSGIIMPVSALDSESCLSAIGCAVKKDSLTKCRVSYGGLCFDFTGLTPGKRYYISDISPGKIIDTCFTDSDFGKIIKYIGVARDSETLFLDLSRPPVQC